MAPCWCGGYFLLLRWYAVLPLVVAVIVSLLPDDSWPRESTEDCCVSTPAGTSHARCAAKCVTPVTKDHDETSSYSLFQKLGIKSVAKILKTCIACPVLYQTVTDLPIPSNRRRGRPRKTWSECVEIDVRECDLLLARKTETHGEPSNEHGQHPNIYIYIYITQSRWREPSASLVQETSYMPYEINKIETP